jgi:hypothetical protein
MEIRVKKPRPNISVIIYRIIYYIYDLSLNISPMKGNKLGLWFCLITISSFPVIAAGQTYVSGGIYSNATWTQSGSPYIVTGNIVVFPGNTLTIEPGVTVKFNKGFYIEIRQATLIAEGTASDSIHFTSNSSNPSNNPWDRIFINLSQASRINYCSFRYGNYGLTVLNQTGDTMYIRNSAFYQNMVGLYPDGPCVLDSSCIYSNSVGMDCQKGTAIRNCKFFNNNHGGISIFESGNVSIRNTYFGCNGQSSVYDNSITRSRIRFCVFENNSTGVEMWRSSTVSDCIFRGNKTGVSCANYQDTVIRCLFENNRYGILADNEAWSAVMNSVFINDTIGLYLTNDQLAVKCNSFLGSVNYRVKYTYPLNTNSFVGNYWGTTDSATIENYIYDGFDNITYGLVLFIPLLSAQCPDAGPRPFTAPDGCNNYPVGISDHNPKKADLIIQPNPVTDDLSIDLPRTGNAQVCIYRLSGEIMMQGNMNGKTGIVDVSTFPAGMYILRVISEKYTATKKFIKL